jgi:lipoprotein-anchoring transpeptidase ErfK/SrfK
MSSLRILGLSYLATASLLTLALVFSDHAALRMVTAQASDNLSHQVRMQIVTPVLEFARIEDEKVFDPQASVPLAAPGSVPAQAPVIPKRVAAAAPTFAAPEPTIIAPDLLELPDIAKPKRARGDVGSTSPLLPEFITPDASNPLPPDIAADSALSPAERAAVTARLTRSLTPEMVKNFDLFLYVSKAKKGPLAQRLYVFRKDAGGALQMEFDWAASTGREQYEISPRGVHTSTATPAGYYELDPARMFTAYHSRSWDQSMPYAMFFNWESQGRLTGLAIHAATGGDIAKLGHRASAGCVHISPAHARMLYDLIRNDYKGSVPRFAYDRGTQTMSNHGEMMRDAAGQLLLADGYKVLIDVEDFSGAHMVAAMD